MRIKRKYIGYDDVERELTDEEIVQEYIEGYVDQYSGGAIEQLERKVENIARNTSEILCAMANNSGKRLGLLGICEDK